MPALLVSFQSLYSVTALLLLVRAIIEGLTNNTMPWSWECSLQVVANFGGHLQLASTLLAVWGDPKQDISDGYVQADSAQAYKCLTSTESFKPSHFVCNFDMSIRTPLKSEFT